MTHRPSSGRRVAITTLAAGLAVALAACGTAASTGSQSAALDGGEAAATGERTLTVLHKWPEPQHEAFWSAIKEGFEDENPGVTVEMTAVQDDPYKEQLKVLTASQSLPDVFFAWPGKYGEQYLEAGLAADLTAALDEDGWLESLSPAAVDAYTVDGVVYAVPISMSAKFMIYNTKIFADHGVVVPETLDDLLDVCATLTAADVQPITFGNQAGWPGVHYLTTLIAKYVPADVVAADFVPETASFTHPGYLRALETLGELSDRCFTAGANGISNDSAKAEVQTGVAAMGYFETNNFSIFTAEGGGSPEIVDSWGFFPFPSIPDGEGDDASLTGAPDGFLVNDAAENKDLAVDFLRYLTRVDNGKLMLEVFGRPSTVIGSADGVDITQQLSDGIDTINSTERFNVWLDTATVSEVAQAFLAGAQAAVDRSQTPEQIMQNVIAASSSASS